MAVAVRDNGNVLRQVRAITVRDNTGTLRSVKRWMVRDSMNLLRTVWQEMSATISPASAYGQSTGATVTTNPVTAIPVGGSGPFSYAWSFVSGDGSAYANSPSAASTSFSQAGAIPGQPAEFIAQVIITDSTGTSAFAQIPVTFERTTAGGGGGNPV